MMWQTMLCEEVFSCSNFLLWMLRFNSITILEPLDVTTACLLHSIIRPIKRRSIECLGKVFLDRDERLIFFIYIWSTCCLTFKWWINWLLHRCLKRYQWLSVCCIWEFFSDSWLVFFLGPASLGLPSLGLPFLFFVLSTTPQIGTLSFIACINRSWSYTLFPICNSLRDLSSPFN